MEHAKVAIYLPTNLPSRTYFLCVSIIERANYKVILGGGKGSVLCDTENLLTIC